MFFCFCEINAVAAASFLWHFSEFIVDFVMLECVFGRLFVDLINFANQFDKAAHFFLFHLKNIKYQPKSSTKHPKNNKKSNKSKQKCFLKEKPCEWKTVQLRKENLEVHLIVIIMSFKLKPEELSVLFNPDSIHRGISLQKLRRLGKTDALQLLLKTSFHKGLLNDIKQHAQRRAFYGTNHPRTKKERTFWELILKNFDDELIRLMIAAGFVSLVLGVLTEGLKWGWIEGLSIFSGVALVIFLSSINDYAHEKSFQIIKGKPEVNLVRAYRGARLYLLNPQEIMVGDIIEIMGGDQVNVDGVLISGEDLMVDESQITGEAIEVKKRVPYTYDRYEGADPFILSSSRVMSGMGIMLILAVGSHSYYGSLSEKMDEEHIDSPLKMKLSDLSNEINERGLVVGIITFTSILTHYLYWCFKDENPMNSLFSSQTLHHLVKAILVTFTIDVALPEMLPLLVTIALAKTAKQLQKERIFVKHLTECETMGSIDNLCLSKTGFVSKNLLSVSEIFVEERVTSIVSRQIMAESTCKILNLAIIMNSLANPKFIEDRGKTLKIEQIGNKTESALLEMAYRMGYNYQRFRFNSQVKRIYSTTLPKKKMATIYKDQTGKMFLFVKGSPKFLLPYCKFHIDRYEQIEEIDFQTRLKIDNALQHFSRTNQKIVIIAYKEVNSVPSKWSQVEKSLIIIAIIGIKDFIREGVLKTIQECQSLGVNVRMLSNQNRSNAVGAAKQIGLIPDDWVEKSSSDYTLLEGTDFRQLVGGLVKEDKESLDRKLALQNFKLVKESLKVIYRASAQDKLLLAIGLKECGHVVAVAGNGTNDTYALRKADVSISMGLTCNDTAKEASDIVILDDKFSSIIKTIKWGRHTLATIKKFLILQLTINLVAAVMALLGAVFVGESPLNPMQMLWINLIIDLLGSLSLILEQPMAESLSKQPYTRKSKILTPDSLKIILVQSLIQVVILSIILFYGPDIFGIVSSVGVEEWSKQAGKHYSLFFNTFIMLQIFNEFNVRVPAYEKLNVFEGLIENPLLLCFSVLSLTLQFVLVKYSAKMLHVTELSFKQNVLCLLLGTCSISGGYFFKIITPKHFKITKDGIELGSFKYYWNKKSMTESAQRLKDHIPLPEAELQLLSPQFSVFLNKRRTKQGFSYIEQKDSIRSLNEESLTEEEEQRYR